MHVDADTVVATADGFAVGVAVLVCALIVAVAKNRAEKARDGAFFLPGLDMGFTHDGVGSHGVDVFATQHHGFVGKAFQQKLVLGIVGGCLAVKNSHNH